MQTALQNFELWNISLAWRQRWTTDWDTRASFQFSHLVIADNPLVIGTVSGGYHWTGSFYTRLGVQYSHDPISHTLTALTELRWSWERGE